MSRAFTLIEILIVVGWVWRDDGNGIFDLYATDTTWLAEFAE